MRKRILLSLLLVGGVLCTSAQSYVMKVKTKRGEEKTFNATDIDRVYFERWTPGDNTLKAGDVKGYLMSLPYAPGMAKDNGTPIQPGTGQPEMIGIPSVTPGSKDHVNGIPGYWVVTTTNYKLNNTFNEMILLDPRTDIIYPGCALKGNSIIDGTYATISDCELGDVTWTLNLNPENEADSHASTQTVHNPRYSDYQQTLNKWANISYKEGSNILLESVEKVNSNEELATKLGLAVKSPIVDFASSFGFNFSKKKNHILAKVIQKGPSVIVDAPRNTPTIFQSVDRTYLENCQPVYVSAINYGRILYLCIDTDADEKEVQQALDIAVKKIKGIVDINANDEVKYKKLLENSDIHITMLGGGQTLQNQVASANLDAVKTFLAQQVPFNQLHPVSFQLRFAVDNSLARVQASSTYSVTRREFVQDFNKVRLVFKIEGIDGMGDGFFGDKYAQIRGDLMMYLEGDPKMNMRSLWKAHDFKVQYDKPKVDFETKTTSYFEITRESSETVEDMCDRCYLAFAPNLFNEHQATAGKVSRVQYSIMPQSLPLSDILEYYKEKKPIVLTLTTNGSNRMVKLYVTVDKIRYME
ncbi:thiol-activated cytolysin family protein [Prevotella sp. S7-1-8]|uniref:thiol-activated cytolysin family protein n=1 Tax=Prevotella sp. S7-1-8 TaxID=1284775 RepID=UPI0009DE50D6|nr:thiol-activated cytolysin family protein [Prevotella sp. S7-1-8]